MGAQANEQTKGQTARTMEGSMLREEVLPPKQQLLKGLQQVCVPVAVHVYVYLHLKA